MSRDFERLVSIVGTVSRETESRLRRYGDLLTRWTRTSNLVAPSTIEDLWSRHILDSAQLTTLRPQARRWLDLGSGGGLPGLVVAILLAEKDGTLVQLVESNAKKAAFLASAVAELGLPAKVLRMRIEDAPEATGRVEVVTARALAPLSTLLGLATPWLDDGAAGLFHKGREFVGELVKSRDEWEFDLIEHPSAVDPQARILEITGLRLRSR